MNTLESIALVNFCQFRRAKVNLARQGLVWIGGRNRDTTSATSNGAGKSNFLKAIGWCLFGETPEDESADAVIRKGAKRTCVTLRIEGGWKIRRERYKGSPRLFLSYQGKRYRGSRAQLQDRICTLVGLTWRSFLNTAFYASRDGRRFIQPRTSNADRQEILFNILGSRVFGGALRWVREQASILEDSILELEQESAAAQATIDGLDFARLKLAEKSWEAQRAARLEALRKGRRELIASAKEARDRAAGVLLLQDELEKLKRKFRAAEVAEMVARTVDKDAGPVRKKAAELALTIAASEKDASQRLQELDRLGKLDRCPVCRTGLRGAAAERHLGTERATVMEGLARVRTYKEDLVSLEKAVKEADEKIARLRSYDVGKAATELEKAEIRRAGLEHAIATARQLVAQARARKVDLDRVKAEPNLYTAELAIARKTRADRRDRKAVIRGEVERLSAELAHWEFWKRGFSPQGLPSFVLDGIMPELTDRANHYLDTLSDGTISVMFATQRELSSSKGEYRDEITITWTIEGVEGRNPSHGQWRKIEIAADLALMDLAMKQDAGALDFLALDEVLDGGLDAVGRQRLITLLHELRQRKGTIFVVSHDSDLAGVFDRSIVVGKQNGIARVKVTA